MGEQCDSAVKAYSSHAGSLGSITGAGSKTMVAGSHSQTGQR